MGSCHIEEGFIADDLRADFKCAFPTNILDGLLISLPPISKTLTLSSSAFHFLRTGNDFISFLLLLQTQRRITGPGFSIKRSPYIYLLCRNSYHSKNFLDFKLFSFFTCPQCTTRQLGCTTKPYRWLALAFRTQNQYYIHWAGRLHGRRMVSEVI